MIEQQPTVIVALGASNTAGYGIAPELAFPAVLQSLLQARGFAVRMLNAGIPGHTTAQMLARLERDVPRETRLMLFQPGSNDDRIGVPYGVRAANIRTITDQLTARGVKVLRVAAAFDAARPGNLQPDGVHYTVAGHDLIARLLVDQVVAVLSS